MNLANNFPAYTKFDQIVPVHCVTPDGGYMHRFFDTCPVSPSGRYIALLKLPFEDHEALPGETAEIVVIDLQTGVEKIVDETAGWEFQLGANINWGVNDDLLFYSDVNTGDWTPHCVKLNLQTGERSTFGRGIYHASPDGKHILCTNAAAMRRTQGGYGVTVPDENVPRNIGLRDDDGLFITDTETGECKLLISVKEAVERTVPKSELAEYDDYENYLFHSKWSPQGDRVLFTLRRFPISGPHRFQVLHHPDNGMKYDVFTMKPDGTELFNAVNSDYWDRGGHHINWFPDGSKLSMNLGFKCDGIMRFTQVNYDGTDIGMMFEEPIGSGHPSFNPEMTHLVTDTYVFESLAFGDGTTPIRLIDLQDKSEQCICRMQTETPAQKISPVLRVDPHPVWNRDFKSVIFNGFDGGTRKVYIADLSAIL